MSLSILFEDHHLIALNKPAPLLTQGPPGVPSLEAMVKAYVKEKYHKPAGVYLGVPHRLDRPVSGAIVFARNTKAAQRLAAQFQQHEVRKTYWAFVEGDVRPDEGTWHDHLRKLQEQARSERVEPGEPGAKEAITEYRVLQRTGQGTLLELVPRTGRMHQLRVQASVRGWPIAGDQLYGSRLPFGPPAELPRERLVALHARTLGFTHPFRGAVMTVEAPLPAVWQTVGVGG